MPSAARALLAIHLCGRGVDLRAILDVSRTAPPLGELVAHHARQDVRPGLEPEHMVGKLDRARLLGVESGNVGLHHSWLPPSAGPVWALSVSSGFFFACFATSPAALRKAPGFGAPSGRDRFTASESSTHPPLAPGTAPRIMISPRSGSVL